MKKLKSRYEVMVIGAGVSGTIAAYTLARKGREVIVLEKSLEEHLQVNPGFFFLRKEVFDFFEDRFGKDPLWQEATKDKKLITRSFFQCPPFLPKGQKYPELYSINRERFIKSLLKRKGITALLQNTLEWFDDTGAMTKARVPYEGKLKNFQAKVMIAADGLNSLVARGLYPNKIRKSRTYQLEIFELRDNPKEISKGVSNESGLCSISFTGEHSRTMAYYQSGEKLFFEIVKPFNNNELNGEINHLKNQLSAPNLKLNSLNKQKIYSGPGSLKSHYFLGRGKIMLVGSAAGFIGCPSLDKSSGARSGYFAARAANRVVDHKNKALMPFYLKRVQSEVDSSTEEWNPLFLFARQAKTNPLAIFWAIQKSAEAIEGESWFRQNIFSMLRKYVLGHQSIGVDYDN